MQIPKKSWIKRLFCKHEWAEGVLEDKEKNPYGFQCISGQTVTVICTKCGQIKGTYFLPYD